MDEFDEDAAVMAAFDQYHASAIDMLREAQSFLVVVHDGNGTMRAASAGSNVPAPMFLSVAAAKALEMSVEALEAMYVDDESAL
jgi:hypothetical protein